MLKLWLQCNNAEWKANCGLKCFARWLTFRHEPVIYP
jgi:hypothetical protein